MATVVVAAPAPEQGDPLAQLTASLTTFMQFFGKPLHMGKSRLA